MKLIVALLVFGIIVMFHEFGHFIVAKKNGVVVEEFAIGMGPKLFGVRRGETEYTLRLLPLGGACMMLGEDTEEEMLEGSFNSKSVWARMAVIVAGPVFNFIMAFFCAILIIGMIGYTSGEILEVSEGSPAMEAGLEAGDRITKVDRTSVHTFDDFRMHMALNQGRPSTVTYERDGQSFQTTVTPKLEADGMYRIGITGGVQEKPGFVGTLVGSFYEVKSNINLVVKSLQMMFQGRVTKDDIAGPVGMFQVIGDSYESAAQYGLMTVILTIANMILLLSANLGVMNLLPIPALDGGRLVFLAIEAIRGKPLPRDKEGFVHMIGFVLLMGLMVLILFNDVARIFGF